ncbi:MAG: hypothetical protein IPK35_00225, partial [Saprospiraceae bacterium]|nr:hypothetical protein [Saprospiraceae bacterium]
LVKVTGIVLYQLPLLQLNMVFFSERKPGIQSLYQYLQLYGLTGILLWMVLAPMFRNFTAVTNGGFCPFVGALFLSLTPYILKL